MHKAVVRLLVLTLLAAAPGLCKVWRVGVKAGAPVTDVVASAYHGFGSNPIEGDKFVIGPVFELQFPFGLGIEADALRRSIDKPAKAAWEFPVLAKLRLGGLGVEPFIAAGLSFTRSELLQAFQIGPTKTASGFAAGSGLEISLPKIHLSPEIRFTRWRAGDLGTDQYKIVNRNQLEFLVGLTF
jgi:hypothetical protein